MKDKEEEEEDDDDEETRESGETTRYEPWKDQQQSRVSRGSFFYRPDPGVPLLTKAQGATTPG